MQARLLREPLHSARSSVDWVRRALGDEGLLACWDLSQELSTVRIIDVGPHRLHGELRNTPSRGVKGPGWSGEYQSWVASAEAGDAAQYDAVHFHEDDLSDCGWRTSLTLPLPADLRSGVYALKLTQDGLEDGEQWSDYVPVFVRPAQPKAKLCFIMPTVSFQCYEHMSEFCPANTRQADGSGSFGGTAWLTVTATGAFLHQLPAERCLGRSTYDHHNDGDGVKYASTLRPTIQTRPNETVAAPLSKALTQRLATQFIQSADACTETDSLSQVWQFPAEAHILAFLEAKGIEYDLLTDHVLHAEGVEAIKPYRAAVTSTHPE